MSALPIQQLPLQEQEAEVIYLVVPPAVALPTVRPYSFAEQMSSMIFNFQVRSNRASEKALALSLAFFITVVAGLWAYNVKSAFGVDFFPQQHIENFAPLPGWQR